MLNFVICISGKFVDLAFQQEVNPMLGFAFMYTQCLTPFGKRTVG